ncbi:MAG TPA: alpha/beta hydrolase [Fimbriiglobus sp.]|jgi:pimeloyl-ACP methyl ester carboxylesterase
MGKSWHRTALLFLPLFLSGSAAAADGTFDSNGVTIHYVVEGKGEPVVLLHGWMSDVGMWGKLDTNPATKEFQLIAVDLRGHGKSGKPHEVEKYGSEMSEDVVRLLDHLKIPKAHLVGYSMGAIVAGKMAATHPDRVLSIVYGGQAPILTEPVKTDAREIDVFAKAVEEGRDLGVYILEVIPAGRPKPTAEEAKTIAKFLYGGKDVKAFAAAGRGIKNLDVTAEQLKKCPAPFLFIHGEHDSAATKERAAEIVKLLGRGKIKVIKAADHITTLTKPEFSSTILEFLRANKAK